MNLFLEIPFPKNFLQICKKIMCRLFRVFVHVYIHHFDWILQMAAEAHVNTCYKHFYYFSTEFNLIDRKELEPLVRTEWDTHAPKFSHLYVLPVVLVKICSVTTNVQIHMHTIDMFL